MVPQSKALLGNFPSNEVESPIQKEVVDLSPGRDDRQSAQVGELKDGGLVPIADACKEDLAVIGSGSPPVVTKEQKTEPTGKAAIASTKKPVRSQESAVGPKTGAKNIMPVESGSTIQQKLDLANPPEGGVIPSGVAAGAFAIPRNEVEATSKGFSETSGVGISSTAPASAASSGSARDEAARGVRGDTTGVEAAVAPVDGSIASPKSSVGLEALATSPVGSDGDGKIQSAPVSVQGFSHVMLSGVEASSSSNPLLVVHGSAQGDLVAATRSQVGDVLQHPSGLASVMRGEEGSVGVGVPIGEAPRTLAATSTSLEVGVQNGMHGWLKIRAEMTDSGVVNASVSTASVAGQELLHRELPALTAYLAEEKVAVNAVVVQAPLAAADDARGSSGMDGAGGQASERSNGGDERNQDLGKTVSNDPAEATTYQSLLGGVEDGSLQFAGYGSGGGWLSVRA